ncbi:MAG: VanZ family protein [Mariprofundaceae bacterium]|nr:VanZ family protein [Mariprofundaceae bacterium]
MKEVDVQQVNTRYMYHDACLLLAYCALIFYLSHQSALPTVMSFPHQDKLVHACAYGVMAILAWRVFRYSAHPLHITLLLAAVFCSLYGISDEYHQSFIVGRNADVWDWCADTVGAVLSMLLLQRWLQRQHP